ncbi:MAG: HD-GYP domain-containing protein, partial [Gemmatimonadota bacterium]
MPGQANHTPDAVLLLVEPADGVTHVAGRLEAAGLRFDRLHDLSAADAASLEPALVIICRRSLPESGPDGVAEALGLSGDVPVLVVSESANAAPEPEEEIGVAEVTWPVSAAALRALVGGLRLDSGVSRGRVRARAPGGAASDALYEEVVAAAEAAFAAAREERTPDLDRARLLAERIHSQLLRDNGLVLLSLEPHGEFDMASHSANVSIIAGKIALGMAMGIEDVVRVIMAGIVHDIGMARLPEGLIRKPGRLDEPEREKLREHPVLGAELLTGVESRHA